VFAKAQQENENYKADYATDNKDEAYDRI